MLHVPNSAEGNCLTEKENRTLCLKSDIKPKNMAAAGEKTLADSELKRSLIGAFHCAFIRALSLVYSFQNKDG